jgi:hypothetical protein
MYLEKIQVQKSKTGFKPSKATLAIIIQDETFCTHQIRDKSIIIKKISKAERIA